MNRGSHINRKISRKKPNRWQLLGVLLEGKKVESHGMQIHATIKNVNLTWQWLPVSNKKTRRYHRHSTGYLAYRIEEKVSDGSQEWECFSEADNSLEPILEYFPTMLTKYCSQSGDRRSMLTNSVQALTYSTNSFFNFMVILFGGKIDDLLSFIVRSVVTRNIDMSR